MKPKAKIKHLEAHYTLRIAELEKEMELEVMTLHQVEMRVATLRARRDEMVDALEEVQK